MYSQIETITPEVAYEYLKRNNHNRPKKARAIVAYSRDMRSGKWQLSPQGISFYENGELADGQNRLYAVIRAGVPVEMYVTYDVPNANTIQDRGVGRTTSDVLHMSGVDTAAATTTAVGAVNFLFELVGGRDITDSIRLAFIEDHNELLCEATRLTARGTQSLRICKKSCVVAAAFCALSLGITENELVPFFVAANSGFSSGIFDSPAIVLRNFILQEYQNTAPVRRTAFAVATNAIKDFVTRQPRSRKYRGDIQPCYWNGTFKETIKKYLEDEKWI